MKKLYSRKLLMFLFSMPFFALPFFISSSIDATIAPPTYQKCEEALLIPTNNFVNYGLADYGVPGKGVIRGVDKVLFFGDKQQLQCFCPQTGNIGTQSDWWNASKLSNEEIQTFKNQGWMYLLPGKDGNVYKIPYLVRNRDYQCKGTPTLTPVPTATPTKIPSVTPTFTVTPTYTHTPTATRIPTPTYTNTPTNTVTPTATKTPTPSATRIPTHTLTPSATMTPTAQATVTPKPIQMTQLKLCKYEDDNGDGSYQDGENVLSWTFHYTYDNQDHTVSSSWWHIWTQGCAIVDVPSGKTITVTEENKPGFRATGLFADGSKVDTISSYSYTSEFEKVKILWFFNTFTPTATPTVTATPTKIPTGTPTMTATPTAQTTVTPTMTATPTAQATLSPTVTVTPTVTQTLSPTATPTPSVSPSLTPTTTPSPTGPTATPPASCSNLALNVKEGTAPLTVSFTGYGNDPRGAIQGYEFNFGDGSNGQQYTIQQDGNTASHTYNNSGTYTAQLRIKDSTGNWRDENGDCKRTITVRAQGQVLGATTELPKTGTGAIVIGSIGAFCALGWFVRRTFFIV
jgi:hypothetical protein